MIVYAMWRSMKSFNCQSSLQILRISSVKFPSFFISEKTQHIDAEEKQNCTVFDFILPDHDVEKLSLTIYSMCHRTYLFSDPIPFVFQRKLSKSSFICDSKYTFQLIMMTHWPHGILSSKHQKYVERRNFWHNIKTIETDHHVRGTVIKFERLLRSMICSSMY